MSEIIESQDKSNISTASPAPRCVPWRDRLPIHPKADKYPLLDQKELIELGDDIKKNGLKYLAVVEETADGWRLCDGRNRLDAMEAVGIDIVFDKSMFERLPPETDVEAYIASANLFRRHLKPEDRRKLLKQLIELDPTKSNLQLSKETKTAEKTVKKVRAEVEARSDSSERQSTRIGTNGRRQQARKNRRQASAIKSIPVPLVEPPVANGSAVINTTIAVPAAEPIITKRQNNSRFGRWADACAAAAAALGDLIELQAEYQDWFDNLPENLQSSEVGEKLQAVCGIDLEGARATVDEAEGTDLPRGFGRD